MGTNGNRKSASNSLLLDNHNRPHQSQWLHLTLAELDRKINMILELVEDNGDTFAQRAEMYYKKRPQLIGVVRDLERSYHALADKYDLLRSESLRVGSSSSNSFRIPPAAGLVHLHDQDSSGTKVINPAPENRILNLEGRSHHYSSQSDQSCGDHELVDEESSLMSNSLLQSFITSSKDHAPDDQKLMITNQVDIDKERSNKYCNTNGNNIDEEMMSKRINVVVVDKQSVDISAVGCFDPKRDSSSSERVKMWNEMRVSVSELIEDNMSQQAELIKRNDEKRESIKQLGVHISQLQNENRRLKDSLAQLNTITNYKTIDHYNVKQNRSQISKLKGLVFGKKL